MLRKPGTGLYPKNLTPIVKHSGGSIMIFGCFSYHGVGRLVVIGEKMNYVKYIDILSRNLAASAKTISLIIILPRNIMI